MTVSADAAVGAARIRIVVLVAATLAIAAFADRLPAAPAFEILALPATLLGAVAPVIAYRLYLWSRERPSGPREPIARRSEFVRSITLAIAAADGAALFGLAAFALTRQFWPLIGLFGLVLSAGALWPTPEKLRQFVDAGGGGGDVG